LFLEKLKNYNDHNIMTNEEKIRETPNRAESPLINSIGQRPMEQEQGQRPMEQEQGQRPMEWDVYINPKPQRGVINLIINH
jgi:hypothetical protein